MLTAWHCPAAALRHVRRQGQHRLRAGPVIRRVITWEDDSEGDADGREDEEDADGGVEDGDDADNDSDTTRDTSSSETEGDD